jgi:hypothetical protein
MNINEVLTYISTQATPQEMARIVDAYKFRQDSLRRSAKAQFSKGDTVTWHNSRTGTQMSGSIAKINQKSIDVRTAQGIWRVGANLLKRA